jgi:NCK adaptor protein
MFTVVLKAAERNKHFRVSVNEEQYQIGQQKFSSLDQLIDHYKKHPIFKQENEKLYLVKPLMCSLQITSKYIFLGDHCNEQ